MHAGVSPARVPATCLVFREVCGDGESYVRRQQSLLECRGMSPAPSQRRIVIDNCSRVEYKRLDNVPLGQALPGFDVWCGDDGVDAR